MSKPQITNMHVTKQQWAKYVPAKTLAAHLRKIAAAISALPRDARGKIKLQIEIGRPT